MAAPRADRGRPAGHRRHRRGGRPHGARSGRRRWRASGFVVELTFLNGREKLAGLRRVLAAAIRQMSDSSPARQARVRALAKINLDLRVLGKRPDGYHELRTIFQTISLADTLDIAFTPGAQHGDRAATTRWPFPTTWWRARRGWRSSHARHRPRRDAAHEAHSHGRGAGRRIVGCGGGAAGAAGAGRAARSICRS